MTKLLEVAAEEQHASPFSRVPMICTVRGQGHRGTSACGGVTLPHPSYPTLSFVDVRLTADNKSPNQKSPAPPNTSNATLLSLATISYFTISRLSWEIS